MSTERLFIAEKPELAKAIVDGLGGGTKFGTYYQCGSDRVTWCIGHMLSLCEPKDFDQRYEKWNLEDLPIRTPIKYKPISRTQDQLKSIIELMQDAQTIIHAGDNDSEGQLIVDEILTYVRNKKPVLRFLTNDNNTDIVRKSLSNMKNNNEYYPLYQSALARNIADQLYGFNMSRAYTVAGRKSDFTGMLIVGRVQTPIMGLVVRRDREHASHVKTTYFTIDGEFTFDGILVRAKYSPSKDDPIDGDGLIVSRPFADSISKSCLNSSSFIEDSKTEHKADPPPLPYNMLNLQVDCSKIYGYKPDEVMRITQELREKYRLITYNGSDCQYLNEEQHADAPRVLQAIGMTAPGLQVPLESADASIKSRAFNNANVTAHHAIIPTSATVNPTELSQKHRNVYTLIATRYLAQFFKPYTYEKTTIIINVEGHQFIASRRMCLNPGWKLVEDRTQDDDQDIDLQDDQQSADIKHLTIQQHGRCSDIKVTERQTNPPKLYTISSLLKDLTRVSKYIVDPEVKKLLIEKDKNKKGENGGIGTPRTRDQIIKKLYDNGYLADKGKNIVSTDLAKQFFDALPIEATSPDMTALWHEQQSSIEDGQNTCTKFIDDLMVFIGDQIDRVKEHGLTLTAETHKCHKCESGYLRPRKSANGRFWGCSNYPDCRASLADTNSAPDLKSLLTVDCPKCKEPMKRIKGKFGFFWPCRTCAVNYADKRGKPDVKSVKVPEVTNHKCEDCGNTLVRRTSKKTVGKIVRSTTWYGCSSYPKCQKTYFDNGGSPKYA